MATQAAQQTGPAGVLQVQHYSDSSASDGDDLLGKAGLPVWLQPERFLQPDFDPEACVADLRRYVPLATLQSELNSYLACLKTKLVEVLNEDYSDYVGLAGRLTNVEGAVTRMRKPLVELKDKLQAVHATVKSELNTLNQGLRRRKEVATQRALLELIQEVAHVAAKVDKLLEEVAAAESAGGAAAAASLSGGGSDSPAPGKQHHRHHDGGGGTDGGAQQQQHPHQAAELLGQCRLLERVAAEVSRLSFLATRGKDLAFIKSLEPRITSHRTVLLARLSAALSTSLQRRDHASALHCLAAYADLGEPTPAQEAVRTVVVAPLVERLIREHKASGPTAASVVAGGAAGGSHGAALAGLLGVVLQGVRQELGLLLEATLSPGSALRSVDILGAAVVDEVQGALAAAMPGVFSPGVPPAFHANYLATLAWLGQLEGLCSTRAAVERLRSGPAYGALMRRWNTSVYFSLLYQDIAGNLEDALHAERPEPAPAPQAGDGMPPLQLAATAALLRCMRRAVSREAVLPPLADRFLRLALQLAQRFVTWLGAGVQARRDAAALAAQPQHGAQPGAGGSPGAAAPPAAAPAAPPGACAWMIVVPAEDLAAAVHDAEAAAEFIQAAVVPAFLELLPPGCDAAADAARAALGEASSSVRDAGRAVAAAIAEEVVERCVGVVRQLKGITATYRMTSKGPPSRHSHYVTGVLGPLKVLLEAAPVRRIGPQLRQELFVLAVVDGTCVRYSSLADELLVSVRKTESSLKRLKKAKAPGEDAAGGGAEAVSDSDKITLQLHLDVQELGSQLVRLYGIPDPAATLPSFRRLQEVVAPPPGLHALVGGTPLAAAAAAGLHAAPAAPQAEHPPRPLPALQPHAEQSLAPTASSDFSPSLGSDFVPSLGSSLAPGLGSEPQPSNDSDLL